MSHRLGLASVLAFICLLTVVMGVGAEGDPLQQYLLTTKSKILAVQDLQKAGVISSDKANSQIQTYLDQASGQVGHTVTLSEVMAIPDPTYKRPASSIDIQQEAVNFIHNLNGLIVGVAILFVVCTTIFLYKRLFSIIRRIPLVVYEVLFYLFAFGILGVGLVVPSNIQAIIGFIGCLMFMGALFTSYYLVRHISDAETSFCGLLFLVWTGAAILYHTELIGWIAVAALLATVHFGIYTTHVNSALGYKETDHVVSTTLAAFALLVVYVVIKIVGVQVSTLAIFEKGALFLGSSIGFLGLLITSMRVYPRKSNYWLNQLIALSLGVLALFVGTAGGFAELQFFSLIFLALYILLKPFDIPKGSVQGWAAVGMTLTAEILIGYFVISLNPELLTHLLVLSR